MRNIRITMMCVVALTATIAEAQTGGNAAPSASRLKFGPPRISSSVDNRAAAQSAGTATNAVTPSTAPTGPSSLTFRNPRTSATWNDSKAAHVLGPPIDADETDEEAAAARSAAAMAAARNAKKRSPAPAPAILDLPYDPVLATDEAASDEPVEMEFVQPGKGNKSATAPRPANHARRDPRVTRASGEPDGGRQRAEVKTTAAQQEIFEQDGPAFMPQPDPISDGPNSGGPISSGQWIQPEYGDSPWVGAPGGPMPFYGRSRDRFWVRADFLAAWAKGMYVPPLATTAAAGTPLNMATGDPNIPVIPVAGVLGRPGTELLFGNQRINNRYRPGGRIQFGMWLSPSDLLGLEGEYFALADQSTRFQANGTSGNPIIMRPFYNTSTAVNNADVEQVSFQDGNNDISGTITVDTVSRIQSAGGRLRFNLGCGETRLLGFGDPCNVAFDRAFLLGYRFMRLDEAVNIREDLTRVLPRPVGTFVVQDSFGTTNQFHGMDMGFLHVARRGRWNYELLTKIALGNTHSVVNIEGSTVATANGVAVASPGGLLAQVTNIGTHTADTFSAVPEVGLTTGYQLTPWLTWNVGYSFIYWSRVLRGGDQIDMRVNDNLIPPAQNLAGLSRPIFEPHYGQLWIHMLNTGLECRY